MWFYLLFLVVIGFCLDQYNKTRIKLYYKIVIIVVVLVTICRYNIGYDYATYARLINNESHELIEFLFSPLSALFAEIAIYYHSPQLLFILFGIPTYVLIFATLKRHSYGYALSVLMFICLCYLNTLSIIRQALAVAITFYAYRYVVEKKFFKYLLSIVLASLFHSSALIALAIYWIPKFRFSHMIICILIAYIGKSVIFSLMVEYDLYSSYLTDEKNLEGGRFIMLFLFMIYGLCLYIWIKQKRNREVTNGLFNIVTVGMTCYILFGPHIGSRVAAYFEIYLYLLLPNLISCFDWKSRKVLTLFSSVICLLFFMIYLWTPILKGITSAYIPYKVFFFQ